MVVYILQGGKATISDADLARWNETLGQFIERKMGKLWDEYPEVITIDESAVDITDPAMQVLIKGRKDEIYARFSEWSDGIIDARGIGICNVWLSNPATPLIGTTAIVELLTWLKAGWARYKAARELILAGDLTADAHPPTEEPPQSFYSIEALCETEI